MNAINPWVVRSAEPTLSTQYAGGKHAVYTWPHFVPLDVGDMVLDTGMFVPITGATMTGPLLSTAPILLPQQVVTKAYGDANWGGGGGGVPEAPSTGVTYGRNGSTTAWLPVLPLAGGTLAGPLLLAADPAAALGAATKQYVDAHVPTGGPFLPLAGGTVTGALNYTATGGTFARAAQDRAADVVNVRDFGAMGDGTTDDTTAIQNALNAGASRRLTVYLPAGTYLQSLALNYPQGLPGMRGDGIAATVLRRSPNTARYQVTANNINGVSISDLLLSGATSGQTVAAAGVVLTGCASITLDRVAVSGQYSDGTYGWGIYISDNTDTVTVSVVRECVLTGNGGPAIQVYGTVNNIAVLGNQCCSNGGGGIGFMVQNAPTASMTTRILVAGNHCVGNGGGIGFIGIQTNFTRNVQQWVSINCNVITDNTGYGISFQGYGAAITGNAIYRNGTALQAGILLNGTFTTVSGNIIDSNRTWGIDAGGGSYNTISGNTISNSMGPSTGGASGTGLNLGAANHCTVTGNVFTANGVAPVDGGMNISVYRYDSGGIWPNMPQVGDDILIADNKFNLTPGSRAWGVLIDGAPNGIVIKNNAFSGGASSTYLINANCNDLVVHNNTYEGAFNGEPVVATAGVLAIPGYADTILLTGATQSMTAVRTHSMNNQAGKISPILTAAGSGYTAGFAVTASGDGTGFAATANLNGPAPAGVGGFTVTNRGSGYTTATLTLSGPGGTGATATALVGLPNELDGRTITIINTSGVPQIFVNGPQLALAGGVNRTLAAGGTISLRGVNGVMTEVAATSTNNMIFGTGNTISTGTNYIISGSNNTISAAASNVTCLGGSNTISNGGVLVNGSSNTVGGQFAVAFGVSSVANGQFSVSIGHGSYDAARQGAFSHSSGQFTAAGDAQTCRQTLRATTTTATPVVATADGAAPSANNVFNIGGFKVSRLRINVVARNAANGAGSCWTADNVLLVTTGAPGTITLQPVTFTAGSGNVAGWAVAASADTTNGGIAIACTGAAATTVRFVVSIEGVEVQ